jgi:hypothetical protein
MDRTAAMAYLTGEYQQLADDAKLSSTQVTSAYSVAVDMSLRQLGVQETDLQTTDIAQPQIIAYLALLDYYALKRFERMLSIKFDVNVGNNTVFAYRSQAFKAVQQLVQDAEERLLKLGYDVGGGPSFQMGRINLDYNEPGWRCAENVDLFGF